MIVDAYNNVAYYHAPKCGSRTVLGWITLLKEPQLVNGHPGWFRESRRGEYSEIRSRINLLPGSRHDWPNKKVPKVSSSIRFCIVRDPIERFISCYTNRILFHKALGGEKSISELIDNFDDICENNPALRAHFKPQCFFYGDDPSIFTHIFKMSELSKVKDLLQEAAKTILPDLHLQQNGSCEKPILSAAQIDWVKDRYAEDYRIFDNWLVS